MRHFFIFLLCASFCAFLAEAHQVRLGFCFQGLIPGVCSAVPPHYVAPAPSTPPVAFENVTCDGNLNPGNSQRLTILDEMLKTLWQQADANSSFEAPFDLWLTTSYNAIILRLKERWFLCPDPIAQILFVNAQAYLNAERGFAAGNNSAADAEFVDCFKAGATGSTTTKQNFECLFNVFNTYLTAVTLRTLGISDGTQYLADYNRVNLILDYIRPNVTSSFITFYDPSYMEAANFNNLIVSDRALAWQWSQNLSSNYTTTLASIASMTLATNQLLRSNTTGVGLNGAASVLYSQSTMPHTF